MLAVAASITVAALPLRRDYALLSPRASIMVLPFRNVSSIPGQDYFADAVTDDVTTDLSRLSDTVVISPGTAFTYKGKAVDPRQIGREFGVRYLLEGSIRKDGVQVQTNAQLVNTRSAAHIGPTASTRSLPIFPSFRTPSPAVLHPPFISNYCKPSIVARSSRGRQIPMQSIYGCMPWLLSSLDLVPNTTSPHDNSSRSRCSAILNPPRVGANWPVYW